MRFPLANFQERTFIVQPPCCLLATTWTTALFFNGPSFVIALHFMRLFDMGGLRNRSLRSNGRLNLLRGRGKLLQLHLLLLGRGILHLLLRGRGGILYLLLGRGILDLLHRLLHRCGCGVLDHWCTQVRTQVRAWRRSGPIARSIYGSFAHPEANR